VAAVVEPLVVAEARTRAHEALAALDAAEQYLDRCRRRGDGWSIWDAMLRVERAGWHYVRVDSWLVAVMTGRVA